MSFFKTATIISIGFVPLMAASPVGARPLSGDDVQLPNVEQSFDNLPGVHPQEAMNTGSNIVCEQIVQHRDGVEPTYGLRYHVLNRCSEDGGPAFQSPMLPPSLEREKRGLGY